MIEKDLSVLEIVTYGHPVLTKKAEEINKITQDIVDLAGKMVNTMHRSPGIGLAAPQVNHSIRLITVDLSVGEKEEDLFILINPELLSQKGEQVLEEGCLSVPGINEKVTRPNQVKVKAIDLQENEKMIEAEGLLARVLCHEIDHINGKLFISRLSPLKKKLLKKKLNTST
ncbi:peptide deformylase [Acidobacteriota bacterium]